MNWAADLAKLISGVVLTDETAREGGARDFGGVIKKSAVGVIRPESVEDIVAVVKFAGRQGLKIAVRGAGHSQSGQSLSDQIVIDMKSLNAILGIQGDIVTVQAGVTWRALLEHTVPLGLAPPVLTNNLDVTVGGTLSTAGLGVSSWRDGTQADQCVQLRVVTGTGEIVQCSADENRDLFDAVRCGGGQFGVICEAGLRLRRCAPKVRTFHLLYDDLGKLFDDLKLIMTDLRFDYLESWCVPCPQGFKKVRGVRQPFAQWFYPLHASVEVDQALAPEGVAEKLAGLKFYKHVHTEESTNTEFFARLDDLFALWKRGGFWDFAHPWMECVLPWQTAEAYISQVLANFPPQALVGGHILLWPARGAASSAPLFMRPPGEFLMGFGLLPAVPPQYLQEVLPRVNMASQAAIMFGGKRYISGWLDFDHAAWKAHYGERWPDIMAAKKKFDPLEVLSSGFMQFEPDQKK